MRGGISMAKDLNPQVLIAGGGPTGITAALELCRFGIPVRIVDQNPGPASTSRAVGIQARTLEEFQLRGLANELVRIGHRATGGDIYGNGKHLVHVDFTRIASPYNYLLFLSQADTERVLREALAAQGVDVEWGVKMAAFGQDSSGVTATLEHSDGSIEEVRPLYVIDAEGAHSIVRSTLDLPFKGKTLRDTYALGDVQVESALPNSSFHIFSSEQGFLGMFPMGGNRFRFIASYPDNNPPQNGQPSLEELQKIYDQRSHIPAKLDQLTWSSLFHINSRMVAFLRVGRVLLVGDSAHIHSPAGAQGMNTGIQDAMNLGWKLALVLQGVAPEALLDTYQGDRMPVMRSIVTRTEIMTRITEGHSALRSFFIHLAPFIADADFVQNSTAATISQIALHYRSSPLSDDHFGDGWLTAGDRVPDVAVRVLSFAGQLAPTGTQLEMNYGSSGAKTAQFEPISKQGELNNVPAEAPDPQLEPSSAQLESKITQSESMNKQAESTNPPGDSTNLFALMNPSRFTLLLANFTDSSVVRRQLAQLMSPLQQLIDLVEIARPAGEGGKPYEKYFGIRPSITFIRPDAYVGFRGGGATIDSLTKYLDRWFTRAAQRQAA
jgi:2-polyprenyl-6-methoxyphenol hydroxylase-like FAD-dependent oxidoreductase